MEGGTVKHDHRMLQTMLLIGNGWSFLTTTRTADLPDQMDISKMMKQSALQREEKWCNTLDNRLYMLNLFISFHFISTSYKIYMAVTS